MTRASLVASLVWIATAAAEARAPQQRAADPEPPSRATSIRPGTYRTTGFVTRFDANGTWLTTGEGTRASGRYTLDGNTVIFRTTPETCTEERVTYRVVLEPEGFRLEFVSDTCQRGGGDYRFVPVRAIAR